VGLLFTINLKNERGRKMKTIQTILTVILVVLMVAMMPNLADAKGKTYTIRITPDQFVPETPADNCEATPQYATSSNADYCRYWVKIQLPKKATTIEDFSYFHAGYGGTTLAYLLRCEMGNFAQTVGAISTSASTGSTVIKLTDDTISYDGEILKGYTYYLLLYVSGDNAYIFGAEVTVKAKK
jgi:hypothetical protein